MDKKKEEILPYKFVCPKCQGRGMYQIGNKMMEADVPCDFKLCNQGEITIEATSKEKANEILSYIQMGIYNGTY